MTFTLTSCYLFTEPNWFNQQLTFNFHRGWFYFTVEQGSPNYGPRAKYGQRSRFIRPAKPFWEWWRNNYIDKNVCFGRMQPFPKQSHYVRSPALELLCNSIGGPRTQTIGDPFCIITKVNMQVKGNCAVNKGNGKFTASETNTM